MAIAGTVAPGFEAVRDAFARNITDRGEVGAAFAAYHRGVKVADLWGGQRDPKLGLPWESDTMVLVFSTTKGMSAAAMAVALSRGLFALDEPVARYWPEFGQGGKERITVRQLLAHEAGLAAIDEKVPMAMLADPEALGSLLARQKPLWEPGTRHAYHAITLGWLQSQLLRRVDPQHRTLGQFFQDEVARPLGAEFYIGLPMGVPDSRLAPLQWMTMTQMLFSGSLTWRGLLAMANRQSLFWRSMGALPKVTDAYARELISQEVPSATGIGEARAIARVYGALAAGGRELGLRPEVLAELGKTVPGSYDEVLAQDTAFHLGFSKPWGRIQFGSDGSAFGCPGLGGSFGFADPVAQVGYGYVCNRLGAHMVNDPRARSLELALYRCLQEAPVRVASAG